VEQHWKEYTLALLAFNILGFLLLFVMQLLQGVLPLNPEGLPGVEPWLAFNRVLTFQALSWRLRKRRQNVRYTPEQGSMLYLAASSLPYHTSGYTTRTHEVICALHSVGRTVHVLTRPGYPWDRKDRDCDADRETTVVGDVSYRHLRQPSNTRPALQYAVQAAPVVAEMAARLRVSVIHAASNHVNALPAVLAARQ